MTDATTIALAKHFTAQAKKITLPEGTHVIDETVTVGVEGVVNKFADEMYVPTTSISLKSVLALTLQRAGFQREAIAGIIVEVMTAAINLDADGSEMLTETIKDIDAGMARVEKIAAALPLKARKGKTTSKVTVTSTEPAFA